MVIVKLSICFLLLMPPLIIMFENPNFTKISSIFELNFAMTIKIIITFSKKLSFFQILISAIFINIFECYFIKNYYTKNDSLGLEIKDKKLRKINQFKFNIKFLIIGFIINSIWFAKIFENLEFYIFDESKKLNFILLN